jgi:uncharacterized membrane protein
MSDAAMTIGVLLLGSGFLLCIYLVVRIAFRHEIEQMAREQGQKKTTRR